LKVLVLLPYIYDTSPGTRFRIEQWARYMERDGVGFDFASFEDEALHRSIYRKGRSTYSKIFRATRASSATT
jgi:hypothetical protein